MKITKSKIFISLLTIILNLQINAMDQTIVSKANFESLPDEIKLYIFALASGSNSVNNSKQIILKLLFIKLVNCEFYRIASDSSLLRHYVKSNLAKAEMEFCLAVKFGRISLVKTLIRSGISPDTKSVDPDFIDDITDILIQELEFDFAKQAQELEIANQFQEGARDFETELLDARINSNRDSITNCYNQFKDIYNKSTRRFARVNNQLSFKDERILESLLDMLDASKDTPCLISAVYTGNTEIVNALLNSGANPNATNSFGQTALMFALICNKPEIAEIILDYNLNYNIDISSKDINGNTALSIAIEHGYKDIADKIYNQLMINNTGRVEKSTGLITGCSLI